MTFVFLNHWGVSSEKSSVMQGYKVEWAILHQRKCCAASFTQMFSSNSAEQHIVGSDVSVEGLLELHKSSCISDRTQENIFHLKTKFWHHPASISHLSCFQFICCLYIPLSQRMSSLRTSREWAFPDDGKSSHLDDTTWELTLMELS